MVRPGVRTPKRSWRARRADPRASKLVFASILVTGFLLIAFLATLSP